MYRSILRAIAFVSFVGWLVTAQRAHRFDPEDFEDDDDKWDDYHLESMA